jgi:hypothetical protein
MQVSARHTVNTLDIAQSRLRRCGGAVCSRRRAMAGATFRSHQSQAMPLGSLRRTGGWSDLIKLSSAEVARLESTRVSGSGRPGAAGRYVRSRSRCAGLPR